MKNEQGNTIVVTMMVIATFAALISVSFDFTTSMNKNGKRAEAYQAATNIADGLLDQAFQVWKTASQARGSNQITTDDLKTTLSTYTPVSASVAIGASGFYYTQDLTLDAMGFKKDFKITHIDGFGNDVTTASVAASPKAVEDYLRPVIGTSSGLRNFYYKAHVGVTVPIKDRGGASVHVEANRYFVKRFKSPWGFAIFYNDNLELNPGADMTVNGWIHSNGMLNTSHNTLHMKGRVTYGDGFEANYAAGDNRRINGQGSFPAASGTLTMPNGGTDLVSNTATTGSVSYLDNWMSTSPPVAGQKQQVIDIAADQFNTSNSNQDDDGYQEVIQAPVNPATDPVEIAKQRFYNKADMLVQISGTTTPVVTVKMKTSEDANGLSIYGPASTDASLLAAFTPAQTVRDNRWGGNVDVTDVDVSKIKVKVEGSTLPTAMTVYVYDSRGTSSVKKGIRLIRGASLPAGGLSFVSQNPIYVQGDYNTNGTYATTASTDRSPNLQPLSNASSPDQTKPTITSTIAKPAAIIGDAVTILSNAWNDTTVNTAATSTITNASKTTVNSAIMTGNVSTTGTAAAPGQYSGGAENFPRFLEDWGGVEFTYWGSMVEMFQSQQATEPWGKSGVYGAPTRRWNFDSRLVNNPPPGTPQLVSYSKTDGRWFLQ